MNSCPCCGEASASSLPAEAPRRRSTARTAASPRPAALSAESLRGDETHCKVLTVGHSTRQIEAFLELLAGHGVTQLVDVRTVPRSVSGWARHLDRAADSGLRLPAVWQQFLDAAVQVRWQSCQHVPQIGPRVMAMQPG